MVIEAQGDVAGSATLLRQLTRAAAQHLPEARITYSLQAARSDHLSFALEVRSTTANLFAYKLQCGVSQGAAAVMTRESYLNPCYHDPCDTADRLSTPLLSAATQINLAALLHTASADAQAAAAFRVEMVQQLELGAEMETLGAIRPCACNETGLPYSCGCATVLSPGPPSARSGTGRGGDAGFATELAAGGLLLALACALERLCGRRCTRICGARPSAFHFNRDSWGGSGGWRKRERYSRVRTTDDGWP